MNYRVVFCATFIFMSFFSFIGAKPKKKSARILRRERRKAYRRDEWGKTMRNMSFDELKVRKSQLVQEKDFYVAIKYLHKMIALCTDLHELSLLMLELADLQFENGNLKGAEQTYKEFVKLYPGHEKIEYASYKSILCCFYATLDAQRDQTKTEETIELTGTFLERRALFTTYAEEVSEIQVKCHRRKLDHEIAVAKDYINRGKITSAQRRIDGINKDFTMVFGDQLVQPELLSLEIALATKQNNPELAKQKQKELFTNFADHSLVVAQTKKSKRSLVDRF